MIDNPLDIKNIHRPLFDEFPGLKNIPWIPLMDGIPTPVQELENFSSRYHGYRIWIKRDDLTSSIYGGNKPRKYEFLLAEALKQGKKKIVTAGGIGTNHGLAAALFANALGLSSKIYMFDQPLTWSVQRKLLMYPVLGSEIKLVRNYAGLVFRGLGELLFHPKSFIMLPGGSPLFGLGSAAGSLGFVNAVFELKQQVDRKEMPCPEYIAIACGSTGSASGLILGCSLTGLDTKVLPVMVSESIVSNPKVIVKNCKKILNLMQKHDSTVPDTVIEPGEDFIFLDGFLGSTYGAVTEESQVAVDTVSELEGGCGFHLDTTYTGKACAAMMDFMENNESVHGGARATNMLLWNTYNSRDLGSFLKDSEMNPTRLPKQFQKYFKEELTCWGLKKCPSSTRQECPAFLSVEDRCWLVKAGASGNPASCKSCPVRNEIERKHYNS
ncbi:pyridoxal-phosphate dependent enzyme [Candidatus Bathyarchaeota archaeon]|nr:pyridoxal-phosphate dependent enzyme [Candidatus Bathyarchaeota archaeon]